jgi:hypothetical protein
VTIPDPARPATVKTFFAPVVSSIRVTCRPRKWNAQT